MNCNDIDRILNEEDVTTLGVAERAAVTSHLATCRDCALEWQAFHGLVAAAVPRMPDDLLARCRTRFMAAARASAVGTATRPLLFVGLFVGAAAAALVGSQFFDDGANGDFGTKNRSALQPAAATSPLGSTGLGTQAIVDDGANRDDLLSAGRPALQPAAATSPLDSTDLDTPLKIVTDAAAASAAPAPRAVTAALPGPSAAASPDTFVLAVSELKRDRVVDADALPIVEAVYAEVVRQLRAIPTITVVTVEASAAADDEHDVDLSFIPPALAERMGTVAGGASTTGGSDTPVGGTLNVFDSNTREVRFDRGADGTVTSSTVPLLVGSFDPSTTLRTETGAGGPGFESSPDSQTHAVDMILGANVRGMRLDAPGAAAGSGGTDGSGATDSRAAVSASTLPAFDYRLDFEATSAIRNGRSEWFLSYRGTGKAALPASSSSSAPVASGLDPAFEIATHFVERLRNTVLPADPAWVETLRAQVLDPGLVRSTRLAALSRLKDLRDRTAFEGRDDTVVQAAVALALTMTDPTERARVWQLLRGAKNAAAIPALANSLLTDSSPATRLEALRTLAADFAGNASARAALEQAAIGGTTAQIRLEATWALRDAAGRNRYVRDTLLDERLSIEERLAPLLFALDQPAEIGGNRRDSVIDDAAAAALVSIVDRAATADMQGRLLARLARVQHPALTEAYLDFLRDAPDETTRDLAVALLTPRVTDPRVRAALESLRYDGSERVRNAATRALARP